MQPMRFEELNKDTRHCMLEEFAAERASGMAYGGKRLTPAGRNAFPDLLRAAIESGTELTLRDGLLRPEYWHTEEDYERDGVVRQRRINIAQASETLALSEFNTCYVRGLSKRLLVDKVEFCQIYRGAYPKWEPGECADHEGRIVPTIEIYNSHRIRYWPPPGDKTRFSIPFSPGCHHTIRRFIPILPVPPFGAGAA